MGEILREYPSPEDLASATPLNIRLIVSPLGLSTSRGAHLIHMSARFAYGEWEYPDKLPGCGPYAMQSYQILFRREIPAGVTDPALLRYMNENFIGEK